MAATKALTPRQQFWLDHLRTCREHGVSLRAYARTHGFSVGALYSAKKLLKRCGAWPVLGEAPSRFVPVQVVRGGASVRVMLANGVTVEVCGHCEESSLRTVLGCASALG